MFAAGQVFGPGSDNPRPRKIVVLSVEADLVRYVYLGDQSLEEKSVRYQALLDNAVRLEGDELPEPFDEEEERALDSDPVNNARVLALLGGEGRDFALRAIRTARRLKRNPLHFARELLRLLVADRAGATVRVFQQIETPKAPK